MVSVSVFAVSFLYSTGLPNQPDFIGQFARARVIGFRQSKKAKYSEFLDTRPRRDPQSPNGALTRSELN